MPPRLMSLFWSTATVLSPEGFGIAGLPAGSTSGVNVRPTPKAGSQVCASAPPGTVSVLMPAAFALETTAANKIAVIHALRARDKGHLRRAVVWGVNNVRCQRCHVGHRAST